MPSWSRSFRIQLTILFGGLALVMSLSLTAYIDYMAAVRLNQDSAHTLQSIARSIANALAANLTEREREVVLLSQSPILTEGNLADAQVRAAFEQRTQTYRNYAWFGVADTGGIVQSAAGGLLEGQNVSERPWFIEGQKGAYLGDVHKAVLLAKLLKAEDPTEPLRFVDFAAPVFDADGKWRGVLAAHAHWSWVSKTIESSLPSTAAADGIEVLIISRSNNVLYPYSRMGNLTIPAELHTKNDHAPVNWGRDGYFLASSVSVKSDTAINLGWRVVVRQPMAKALAPAADLHRSLLFLGGLATILFMYLAYRLAATVSQPIEKLAKVACRIRQGDEETPFAERSNVREVDELSDSLHGMTNTLIARRNELEEINATLEQKVQERTAELSAANRELECLARQDALTGLANRLAVNEQLHEEFLRMKRTGGVYSVLLMDIDHFKQVNDTHGHEVGDHVLKHMARILQGAVRETDFVARFGGEEFLVILPDTDQGKAWAVAEKIRAAVADATVPAVGQVTLSIGVAQAGSEEANEEDAVRRADKGLYQAKAEGRNRVAMANP